MCVCTHREKNTVKRDKRERLINRFCKIRVSEVERAKMKNSIDEILMRERIKKFKEKHLQNKFKRRSFLEVLNKVDSAQGGNGKKKFKVEENF